MPFYLDGYCDYRKASHRMPGRTGDLGFQKIEKSFQLLKVRRFLAICVGLLFITFTPEVRAADFATVHHIAVTEGYSKLPIAESLRTRFGAWSFIGGAARGSESNVRSWQTLTFIFGRYEVAYDQDVIVDESTLKVIKPVGEGKLFIKEIDSFAKVGGAWETNYGHFQKKITGEELEKLFASNWDFNILGYKLNQTPLEGIESREEYWNSLYPMQKVSLKTSRP